MDWLLFGAYLTRNGVSAGCGENTDLRDAILNAFFDMMYMTLRNTGMKKLEFYDLEASIRQRFQQYDDAMSGAKVNPLYAAALDLSTNIFGETVDAAGFAMLASFHSADTLLGIKNYSMIPKSLAKNFMKAKRSDRNVRPTRVSPEQQRELQYGEAQPTRGRAAIYGRVSDAFVRSEL